MSKGVKKVRQSIEQRKKSRHFASRTNIAKQIADPFVQEEEKHGFDPLYTATGSSNSQHGRIVSGLIWKGILSAILFLSVAIIWQTDSPRLQSAKSILSTALVEEFPFAKVNLWYQDTFGSPLAFIPDSQSNHQEMSDNSQALPVNGSVSESFQTNGTGIKISTDGKSDVTALGQGIVIFAGNDRRTNKTIVIQHPDNSLTTYGELSNIDVHLYEHVAANQAIGQFAPTDKNQAVYFSIEKDNQYIDPVQVIKVDDVE
ncbi:MULTISPECIES: M23 family metallopeptidase [Clostridia]|uniref:M23 family metallopeptidase n=1 Tax=Clostridia TaxID=186801 RepID=UPI000EA1183C|nr:MULTISPECIES: M23 family metallopeptidase [Clostridia]NBJ68659.1 M23 family peptidase [Roseburia sp. 1XD42-34]RKI80663.1 M23 family metallopeptidase [Clostridium sp. 1xD42-85]